MTLLVCLCACQDKDNYPDKRTPEDMALKMALIDSVQYMVPGTLERIIALRDQSTDSLDWYDYHIIYGHHFLITSTPDSVLPYAERVLQFTARQEPTPRINGLAAYATSSKASYYYLLHHSPDTVMSLYMKAYELMMQSDAKHGLTNLSANIADAYVAVSDLPNASKWYRRALYLTDSLGMPHQQTLSLYMGLGRIYTILRDYEQAGEYYKMTERRMDELKPNMQSYFLNNYGNYFYFRQDYPQALKTFRRLKAHLEHYHAEKNYDMYLCKINMSDVFLNLEQTDSARIYLAEPEEYFRANNVDVGVYYAQTIRIGIALKERRYDEVKRIVEESRGLKVSDIEMQTIRNRYMNRYYAAIGDYEKAYAGLAVNIRQTDSADFKRNNMRSSDVMTRLTEDTIRLHHQLELQQREIEYEKSRIWGLSIMGLLIIVFLLTVIYINQQRKRYLKTRLDMLSQRMLNARQRISPHFIFNVLNSHVSKATDSKEADQLKMLAQLIRTNLDLTHKTFVALDEELDFVRRYVDMERKANGLECRFSIEAPDKETLHSIKLPSMLIQILTENAILHGLKNKEGEKRLHILVEDLGAEVRITVSDNGPGFDIRQYNSERARTGLNIIRSTVSTVNQENNCSKMRFDIRNDGGCHAILTVSKDIKFPPQTI